VPPSRRRCLDRASAWLAVHDLGNTLRSKAARFPNSAASSRCATPAGRRGAQHQTMALQWLCLQDLHLHRSGRPASHESAPRRCSPASSRSLLREVARAVEALHQAINRGPLRLGRPVQPAFPADTDRFGSGRSGCLSMGTAGWISSASENGNGFSQQSRSENFTKPATGPSPWLLRSSRASTRGALLNCLN